MPPRRAAPEDLEPPLLDEAIAHDSKRRARRQRGGAQGEVAEVDAGRGKHRRGVVAPVALALERGARSRPEARRDDAEPNQGNNLNFAVHRAPTTVAFAVFIDVLMWALTALALTMVVARRAPPPTCALIVVAIAMAYLMLFNPRTELGSYLGLAAVVGVFMVRGGPLP